MFQIVEGDSRKLADVHAFIDQINKPSDGLVDFFDRTRDVYVSRGPARLDVMGGIADYSGSLVLEMTIAEATLAALQVRSDDLIKIISASKDSNSHFKFEADLAELLSVGRNGTYDDVRTYFASNRRDRWGTLTPALHF